MITLTVLFLLSALGSLWGAIGGVAHASRLFRVLGLPMVITGAALGYNFNPWYMLLMLIGGAVSIGYGIPTPPILPDIDSGDEGAPLGRFFYKLFNGNELLANIFTRGTIGIAIATALLILPMFQHNWSRYFISSGLIIFSQAALSWRNLGTILFFGKPLNKVDVLNYFFITLACLLVVFY